MADDELEDAAQVPSGCNGQGDLIQQFYPPDLRLEFGRALLDSQFQFIRPGAPLPAEFHVRAHACQQLTRPRRA